MTFEKQYELPIEGQDLFSIMESQFYRDEFLAIASHELKTPLTSLKLKAQVFKRLSSKGDQEFYSKDKVNELIEHIDLQSTRLVKLIDGMLDISRIRTGKLNMVKERFNLSHLYNEVCRRFGLRANEYQDFFIHGDRQRLEQVFEILLKNAFMYGRGFPVSTSIGMVKGRVTFSVMDHGVGISKEQQRLIFQRFQRGVPASEVSGFGLGLYIAKEIVTAHNGKISVKSELNKGSVFTVKFKPEEHS